MADEVQSLIVGVPKETSPGERRVALVPATAKALAKSKLQILIEPGAGEAAGFPDSQYLAAGCQVAADRDDVFRRADVIAQVRAAGANPKSGSADYGRFRAGQTLIAMCDPLSAPAPVQELAKSGVTAYSLELIPRITRAQSMDVLSSMATIAGYKAVLLAAVTQPRMFPMLTTAAGTITAAKVFIIGAGVAGLQAIATAKRLGGVVRAYDLRPAVKEQVESLGGKFVEFELPKENAEQAGGYAKQMSDEFYRKQQEQMAKVIAESDVVIATAAVPGKKAPILVTADMVKGMAPGSVIVDLAAERGGNCELTKPGETIETHGVTILGPENLPSTVPYHASEMFARNVTTFLTLLAKGGVATPDKNDEVIRDTMICQGGEVVGAKVRELLGMAPLAMPAVAAVG